jgi:hypothetical protein
MRLILLLLFALLPTLSHGGAGASGHALLHGFTGCAAAELQGEGCAAYMCPSSGGTACVASFALGVLGFEMATVRAIANQGENALSLYHQQAFRGGANGAKSFAEPNR